MASLTEIVQLSLDGQPVAVASMVDEILAAKIHGVLEARKQMVARQLFGDAAVDAAIAEPEVHEEIENIEVDPENAVEDKEVLVDDKVAE
jgi:hypothetical protein